MDAVVLTADAAEQLQARIAGALARRGVARGERVALLTSDGSLSAERLCLVAGALRSGVIPTVLHAALTAAERDALLRDAECSLVVDDAVLAELVSADAPPAELAAVPLGRPMLYTSGTTGRPKGVVTGLLSEVDAAALVRDEADLWAFAAGDRHLVVSPVHHSAPFRFAAGTLLAGGTVAIAPDTHDPASAVRAFRPTTTFLAPVHLQRLIDGAGPGDLDSLRLVAHAGSPCPLALKERALAAVPTGALWEFYGSTEGQFSVSGPDEWLARPGTVGRARPGRELSIDADGLIWCRAPSFARFEYWRDDDKTRSAWRGDAFSVGDLGRIDAGGYLFLEGRRDDLIISGGVNVYPNEVERAVLEHPDVSDVVVFGVDDHRWGQMVCAAVVGPVGETDLRAHVEGRLAPYKRPKRWLLVDALPHTSTGKRRRSDLARTLGL